MILLWPFYKLMVRFLSILFVWHPKVRERLIFETKNIAEPLARSFKAEKKKADLCFEFSSEGEYQQVASLIQDALVAGKKLELVFFSPSVEKTIQELAARYPTQIRYLRFPLLRSDFLPWITAQELILVRYDLFPEFLIWAGKRKHVLKMIWVSFKKSRMKGKKISHYKQMFLKRASQIIYASEGDKQEGESLGYRGEVYDFRMDQIQRRIDGRKEKFQKIFPGYESLKKIIEQYPRDKRLIIGNAWPSDLILLESLPADFFVLVVPHKLEAEILEAFVVGLKKIGRSPLLATGEETISESKTVILNKKGVLCELYADFGRAYVGGGLEASIHSVLEPLVAGSEALACGPMHLRSTEYDIAQQTGRMTEVNNSGEFLQWLQKAPEDKNHNDLAQYFGKYSQYCKEVISC